MPFLRNSIFVLRLSRHFVPGFHMPLREIEVNEAARDTGTGAEARSVARA
jgi:hypothetical protein